LIALDLSSVVSLGILPALLSRIVGRNGQWWFAQNQHVPSTAFGGHQGASNQQAGEGEDRTGDHDLRDVFGFGHVSIVP